MFNYDLPLQYVICQECGRKEHEVCVLHVSYVGNNHTCKACLDLRQLHQSDCDFQASTKVQCIQGSGSVQWRARNLPKSNLAAVIENEMYKEVASEFSSRIVVRTVNHSQEHCDTKPRMKRRSAF